MVIGTTSAESTLREMDFLSVVSAVLRVPSLTSGAQVCKVLEQLGGFSAEDLAKIKRDFSAPTIEIKKLVAIIESAKQAEGESFADKFLSMVNKSITVSKKKFSGLNPIEPEGEEDE